MNGFLDLLVLGSLVLLFASIYRKRPTPRVRFWLIAWSFVLVHFAALVAHPRSVAMQGAVDIIILSSLVICGICFTLSAPRIYEAPRGSFKAASILGVPWLLCMCLTPWMEHAPTLLLLAALLGECGALGVALGFYARQKHVLVPLLFSIAGCTLWLLRGWHGDANVAVNVVLTQCFLLNAVLYSFDVRRTSAGTGAVALSFYSWALVWPIGELLAHLAPGITVNAEIWNLPKYFVAVGMVLTLLEEEIIAAGEASGHYRLLFESNPHPMWMFDSETLAFIRVNDAATQHYGYSREEFLSMTMADVRPGEEFEGLVAELKAAGTTQLSGPWRHQRKNGSFVQVDIASHLLRHEGKRVTFALMQDVTERQRLHDQLVFQANHDILTGLPNRGLLEDRIRQTLAQASRYGHKAALLCLDVDRFKQINDTYGHSAGDTCLKELGRRLSSRVRAIDTVARTGGEEFAILLHQVRDASDAERVATDLLEALKPPVSIDSFEIDLSASIGIALYPDHGSSADVLWRDADTAMYRAKHAGGNQYLCVSDEISTSSVEVNELAMHLRRALKEGGLELYYQPQYTMTGHLCGLEALIRLHHPTLGMIYPDRFIPIAEESGLIVPMGNWVLGEVCRQSLAWQRDGLYPPRIAFNVSPLQLTRFDFCKHIIETLEECGLSPRLLEMEVTESTVMRNISHVARQIETLARLGIHFSVDDFGTGYSSLGHLHQLPVQTLKIDRSFIERICEPNGTYSIVQAIIFLAHSLGMLVVAEGVEREDQLERLRQLECDRVQGFLFAPPLPADTIVTLLRGNLRNAEAASVSIWPGQPTLAAPVARLHPGASETQRGLHAKGGALDGLAALSSRSSEAAAGHRK